MRPSESQISRQIWSQRKKATQVEAVSIKIPGTMGVARQVILALVLTATSASAFVPSTTSLSAVKSQRTASWTTVRRAEEEAAAADAAPPAEEAAPAPAPAPTKPYLETIYGVSKNPVFGGKPWDPMGLATIGTDGTLDFFRAAEVKHGRIAMAAFLGFAHHKAGIVFPGLLSVKEGISFADLGAVDPVSAWSMVPYEGVLQIFGFMSVIEWYAMTHKEGKWVGAVRLVLVTCFYWLCIAVIASSWTDGALRESVRITGRVVQGHPRCDRHELRPARLQRCFSGGDREGEDAGARERCVVVRQARAVAHGGSVSRAKRCGVVALLASSRAVTPSMFHVHLANAGRLAMIGAIGCACACQIPGSVPLLSFN